MDKCSDKIQLVHLDTEKHGKPSSIDSSVPLPPWYENNVTLTDCPIGLICKEVDSENNYKAPTFIPFEKNYGQISLGYEGDIALKPWNVNGKLYSPNVIFEYEVFPLSHWTIRSLKGHRTGKKAIIVNRRLISAESDAVPVKSGDSLRIGLFLFEFISNTREEFIRYESPSVIISEIEKKLKSIAVGFSPTEVPAHVKTDILSDGLLKWDKAYLRHYRLLIIENWDDERIKVLTNSFSSKSEFNDEYKAFNDIRNTVMHPTKGELSSTDKEKLVDFYMKII